MTEGTELKGLSEGISGSPRVLIVCNESFPLCSVSILNNEFHSTVGVLIHRGSSGARDRSGEHDPVSSDCLSPDRTVNGAYERAQQQRSAQEKDEY